MRVELILERFIFTATNVSSFPKKSNSVEIVKRESGYVL